MAAWHETRESYAELRPEVKVIVDRNAEREAKRLGITVDEARENIAARVVTTTPTYRNGRGH